MDEISQNKEPTNGSISSSNSLQLNTPEMQLEQIKNISETGIVDIDWPELKHALKLRLASLVDYYINKNSDCKEEQYQEPNVEKFDLENSQDEILELIESFNEAPFTIQRICELLYSQFKYYDKISTFLRGLEKNLRVISSNNWPSDTTSSNNPTSPQQTSYLHETLPGT